MAGSAEPPVRDSDPGKPRDFLLAARSESGSASRFLRWYQAHPVLRARISIPAWLWILCSLPALCILNEITAGTSEYHTWSLFGIWRNELRYLANSDSILRQAANLFRGQHSLWLWLYTAIHLAAAVTLGWAFAAILRVGAFLRRHRSTPASPPPDRPLVPQG